MEKDFFGSEAFRGILIFGAVVLSLVIANTGLGPGLQSLLDQPLGFDSSVVHLRYSVQSWVNDGLMAIFFLLVGLEIKRELVSGELSTPKKALLPILCAIGGAITPAVIYYIINHGTSSQSGWGIPMATDIAFALAILGTLSKVIPPSIKVFLTALAIVDDLLAILVIAIFYAGHLHTPYLLGAGFTALLLSILNYCKVGRLLFYLIPGMCMWYFIHHSGVHATIAGVITAAFIPVTGSVGGGSPLEKLEHALAGPVGYFIVPVFAFCNTNIRFEGGMIEGLGSSAGLGIMAGLLIGKPLGVLLVSFAGIRAGVCQLPERSGWSQMVGVGVLAGIGFTMSIFMALLSFDDQRLISQAKFAVLCASTLSAVIGYFILRRKGTSSL